MRRPALWGTGHAHTLTAMRTGETLFYLEMRDRRNLPESAPEPLQLVERTDLETVRRVTLAIAAPYQWSSVPRVE